MNAAPNTMFKHISKAKEDKLYANFAREGEVRSGRAARGRDVNIYEPLAADRWPYNVSGPCCCRCYCCCCRNTILLFEESDNIGGLRPPIPKVAASIWVSVRV